jgi:hypothetical protein
MFILSHFKFLRSFKEIQKNVIFHPVPTFLVKFSVKMKNIKL